MGEIEHKWTSRPVCPHCGYAHQDGFEWADDEDQECGVCERRFRAMRHVSVDWVTTPLDHEEGDDE